MLEEQVIAFVQPIELEISDLHLNKMYMALCLADGYFRLVKFLCTAILIVQDLAPVSMLVNQ